jgi:hypothetical protein
MIFFFMSFIILVFKMLHPKPSVKILNISVFFFKIEIDFFLNFRINMVFLFINKLFKKFSRVLRLLLYNLNFHNYHV